MNHSSLANILVAIKAMISTMMTPRVMQSCWVQLSLSFSNFWRISECVGTSSPSCVLACLMTCAMYSSFVVGSSLFMIYNYIFQYHRSLHIQFSIHRQLKIQPNARQLSGSLLRAKLAVDGGGEFGPVLKLYSFNIQLAMKKLHRQSYYQVESIEDVKLDEQGNRMYLIKWKDWAHQFNTWEPLEHLSTIKEHVTEFDNLNGKKVEIIEAKEGEDCKITGEGTAQKVEGHAVQDAFVKMEGEQAEGIYKTTKAVQPVKRKRGRPKFVKNECQQLNQPSPVIEAPIKTTARRIVSIPDQNIQPLIDLDSQPIVKLEEQQPRKRGRKRKQIHKLAINDRENLPLKKQVEGVEEIEEIEKVEEVEEEVKEMKESVEPVVHEIDDQDESDEQLGLEQVLLQCKNYTEVKVSFKNNTFLYEIPYFANGEKETFTTTAEEIMKVNPRWFEGYFEGFYL